LFLVRPGARPRLAHLLLLSKKKQECTHHLFKNVERFFFWGGGGGGVKRPGRGFGHPSKSSAEVKERIVIHLFFPLKVFMACSRVKLAQLLCEEAETEWHLILKCTETDRWREQI